MTDLNTGTKQCNNCGQNINAASFLMHEAFCLRNIVKCSLCSKSYDKNLKDKHFEEFHSKVKCECGEVVETGFLESHKFEVCPKRQVECFYCDLSLDFDKFENHLDACGARTELCDNCKKYVLIKDKNKHLQSNCSFPSFNTKPSTSNQTKNIVIRPQSSLAIFPCEFCEKQFVGFDELIAHQINCQGSFYQETENIRNFTDPLFDYLSNDFDDLEIENHSDDDSMTQINRAASTVPCEFCNNPINFGSYEEHLKTCGKFRKPLIPDYSPMASSTILPSSSTSASSSGLNPKPSIKTSQTSPVKKTPDSSTVNRRVPSRDATKQTVNSTSKGSINRNLKK